jgi:uncharacterized protein YkwD
MAMVASAAVAAEPAAMMAAANVVTYHAPRTCNSASAADETLSLINQERVQSGLPSLKFEPRLSQAARAHAEEMMRNRQLSHQFAGEAPLAERLAKVSVPLDSSSENVTMHLTTAGAHTAFMGSAPHRANILNPKFDAVGIAVLCDADWLYVVEDFAHLIPELPDAQVAEHISNKLDSLLETSGARLLRVNDARVDQLVDAMASRGTVTNSGGLALPGALCLAGFTTTNPDTLPSGLAQMRTISGAAQYAVGVRFARTAKYPNGTYWVVVVLFSNDASYASVR